jgi:hypothetical protein
MPRRSVGALSALALAVTFVLAACSSGSATSPVDSSAPSVVAPETSAEPATSIGPEASTASGGGVDDTLTPGTTLNACEIVTSDDIKTATKSTGSIPAGTLKESPTVLSPGQTECRYEGDFGGIIVELTPEDGENLYDAAAGAYKDMAVLPGIGDGAFNSDDNNRAFVWKGDVTVMLTMFVGEGLEQADVASELGKAIVGKL